MTISNKADVSAMSDYTQEEFLSEFECEPSEDRMYEEDVRREAEFHLIDGGTYQVGRVPDQQYLLVNSNHLISSH